MTFTLIMATLGRYNEVTLFFQSLAAQTYKDFGLIVVDQNNDGSLDALCDTYSTRFKLTHIKSARLGLSANRNIGLEYLKNSTSNNEDGHIIAFPDDDCEYTPDTLQRVSNFFNENPNYDFYTCNTRCRESDDSILDTSKNDTDITPGNILNIGISFTIFVRSPAYTNFRFDEKLGVGTKFGSGEESDMLIFLLHSGNHGRYHSNEYIYHPAKIETPEKAYHYGLGFGAFYKKAVLFYGFWNLLPIFFARLAKGVFNILVKPNKHTRLQQFRGRLEGFRNYKITYTNGDIYEIDQ